MSVNGMPFLTSIAHKIKFTAAKYVKGRSKPVFLKSIKNVVNVYRCGGFVVDTLLMDGELDPLRSDLTAYEPPRSPEPNIGIQKCTQDQKNKSARSKNAPALSKQRYPFRCLPSRLIIEMVYISTGRLARRFTCTWRHIRKSHSPRYRDKDKGWLPDSVPRYFWWVHTG